MAEAAAAITVPVRPRLGLGDEVDGCLGDRTALPRLPLVEEDDLLDLLFGENDMMSPLF